MSLNAATIAVLLAKGLSGPDILEVAQAMECRADPTATERKRRQRKREQEEKADCHGVTVTRDTTPNGSPKDIYQTPSLTPVSPCDF